MRSLKMLLAGVDCQKIFGRRTLEVLTGQTRRSEVGHCPSGECFRRVGTGKGPAISAGKLWLGHELVARLKIPFWILTRPGRAGRKNEGLTWYFCCEKKVE